MVELNQRLVKKQKLTQQDIDNIMSLHESLDNLFAEFEITFSENTPHKTAMFVSHLEDIEFALQRAWKFGENKSKHSWWFRSPHCKCPKMDNWDLCGVETKDNSAIRVINDSCHLHGKL